MTIRVKAVSPMMPARFPEKDFVCCLHLHSPRHTLINSWKLVKLEQGAVGHHVTDPLRRDQKLLPSDVCLVAA